VAAGSGLLNPEIRGRRVGRSGSGESGRLCHGKREEALRCWVAGGEGVGFLGGGGGGHGRAARRGGAAGLGGFSGEE
jgi:hypothetical protein